ncbi:hypothetical protein R5R35_014015 [Gryllus longicercus]|uniref:L-dopachrome isomerase n=1 Tax=Gryllus longicercus TaxID=2509291 RepID=A0AAN9W4X2_9ORTH
MPHFRLETNVPKSKIPSGFLKETCKVVAKTLGKPESYCVTTVVPDAIMSWSGTDEPCGIATLMSIGQLGTEQNKKHAKVLHDHVEKSLGIPNSRLYIHFIDASAADVGYQATTFHEIFGGK